MARFPVDAPLQKVMRALETFGFEIVREGSQIAMSRSNKDGSRTPPTLPTIAALKVLRCAES